MPITALPTPVPTRADPANFSTRADAFLTALPTFATEANALQTDVNAKQVLAANSATAASDSETAAAASAAAAAATTGVIAWVSGTTYALGNTRYDTTDFQTYRRKVAGAGTTRPGLDPTNWLAISGDATLAGVQTFTAAKTFSSVLTATAGITATGNVSITGGAWTPSNQPAHSATPTFNTAVSNVFEPAAMTSNITAITLSNPSPGQTINIRFLQDSTGGRTVAAPTGAKVSGSVNTAVNGVSWLILTYSARAARWEGSYMQVPA